MKVFYRDLIVLSCFAILSIILSSYFVSAVVLESHNYVIPGCADVYSATIVLNPTDYSTNANSSYQAGAHSTESMLNTSGVNQTAIAQRKVFRNRVIESISFVLTQSSPVPGMGNVSFKVWNISSGVIEIEKDLGFANASYSFQDYQQVNFTDNVVLNGEYYVGIARDNVENGSLEVVYSQSESSPYTYDMVGDEWVVRRRNGVWANYTDDWDLAYNFTFVNNGYPENPSFNMSSDEIWNYTGVFSSSNTTSDFSTALNSYIDSCTLVNGDCLINFTFYSNSTGSIDYVHSIGYDPCSNNFITIISGGGGGVLREWNPEGYDAVSISFESLFMFEDFSDIPSAMYVFFGSLIQYVLKQPATLVDLEVEDGV